MVFSITEYKVPSFTPSTPAAIDVSRLVYFELITHNLSLSKSLLPECLDYYTTACIWMRMLSINCRNFQPLDEVEKQVLEMIQNISFNVPEPIMLQLKQLGNVVTFTKQHLRATFPTLPQEQIGGRGGYYGVLKPPGPGIDDSLHNLYEEIPCLGVLSEAIMHAISEESAGPYQSVVTYESLQPNKNLIGFRPLNPYRHQDAKNIAFDANISTSHFPDYPANSAINLRLLTTISNILGLTKGLKMSTVNFSTLNEAGSASQTIVSRPLNIQGQTNLMSAIRTTSLARNSHSLFEEAYLFCSQLMKDSGSDVDHTRWCMISPAAGLSIPSQWVDNRNQRRNLPIQYMQEVFGVYHSETYRSLRVHKMLNAYRR